MKWTRKVSVTYIYIYMYIFVHICICVHVKLMCMRVCVYTYTDKDLERAGLDGWHADLSWGPGNGWVARGSELGALSRRSLCRAPALSASGPGALCLGGRRSLCRAAVSGPGASALSASGPALSVSGLALCVRAVLGPGGLCALPALFAPWRSPV